MVKAHSKNEKLTKGLCGVGRVYIETLCLRRRNKNADEVEVAERRCMAGTTRWLCSVGQGWVCNKCAENRSKLS